MFDDSVHEGSEAIHEVFKKASFWEDGSASEARDVRPKKGPLPPLLIGGANILPLDGPDPVFSADWLSLTLKSKDLTRDIDLDWFYRVLYRRFDCLHVKEVRFRDGDGRNGYEKSIRFFVSGEDAGGIFYGGLHQRNTIFFELKGAICAFIKPVYWYWIFRVVRRYGYRITRFDLAADFFRGECCVRCLYDAWKNDPRAVLGNNGRLPSQEWRDSGEHGATLTLGGREAGRQICTYEKGRFLGDVASPWTRVEMRWRVQKNEIPAEILSPEFWLEYLRGSGPWWAKLFPIGGFMKVRRARPVEHESMLKSVIHGLVHCSKQYGRLLYWLGNLVGPVNAFRLLARSDGTWSKVKKFPQLTSEQASEMMNVILSRLAVESNLPREFQPVYEYVEDTVSW